MLLSVPAALLSLFIASVCKNMWISLGVGIVCVFTASMLPPDNFILSLFPFALPFQIPVGMESGALSFFGTGNGTFSLYFIVVIAEVLVLFFEEILFLKIMRSFE